jgi:hypothetical protein
MVRYKDMKNTHSYELNEISELSLHVCQLNSSSSFNSLARYPLRTTSAELRSRIGTTGSATPHRQ